MKQKILITSALPYANGPLHFGHIAGAYLPADCYARFQRLMHNDVLYICGSDEYGVAITLSADLAGRTPKQQVDLFHTINRNFFEQLQIKFDHYSRTTWEGHTTTAQEFFVDLYNNGHIEARSTDQLYSESDQSFLADRYVVGTCPRCNFEGARGDECQRCGASYEATDLLNPRSKITGTTLVRRSTEHWFLLLEHFQEQLKAWIESKQWKPNVINFIKGYIDDLHARAITRDSTWGIPVPISDNPNKVLYVWFDAPIGYISATKEWAIAQSQPERWKDYWLDQKTKLVQFIGKDNIPFHASIFPAMIMGQSQEYKLVDDLPANEFYLLEGRQFSKSDGWYIDLEGFFKHFTSDQIRYTISANAPESADSEFTWKDFQQRCNIELVGKYGNLVNRVLTFMQNRLQGIVPGMGELEKIDQDFLHEIKAIACETAQCYDQYRTRRASQCIMQLAQAGNVYFDAKKPWIDVKSQATTKRMETTIACCLECIKALALISYPIIPDAALKLWQMLGFEQSIESMGWEAIMATHIAVGIKLSAPTLLFAKIEDELIDAQIQKLQQIQAAH